MTKGVPKQPIAKESVQDDLDDKAESVKKWGAELSSKFTIVPTALIELHTALKMDAYDLAIIMLLVSHWWEAAALPFPSKKRMAAVVGIDESNIRKRVKKMEEKGLLLRKMRKTERARNKSSYYDMSGLVDQLVEAKKAADAKKKPKIRKVPTKKKPLKPKADG